ASTSLRLKLVMLGDTKPGLETCAVGLLAELMQRIVAALVPPLLRLKKAFEPCWIFTPLPPVIVTPPDSRKDEFCCTLTISPLLSVQVTGEAVPWPRSIELCSWMAPAPLIVS